jgi:valyl-tRNA synthetase
MPFVAESLWQALAEAAPDRGLPEPGLALRSAVIAPWPRLPEEWRDVAVEKRMARMQDLVRSVREVRNRYRFEPKMALDAAVRCSEQVAEDLRSVESFIMQLAGVGALTIGPETSKPPSSTTYVGADFEAYVSLAGKIDVSAEIERLKKQLTEKRAHLKAIESKLDNAGFVQRAPAEVVGQQRELAADARNQIEALEANLRDLRAS